LKKLNIELAYNCANCEKAIMDKKMGKMLSFWFDSDQLAWKLPDKNAEEAMSK
jgi:hypothetical protein